MESTPWREAYRSRLGAQTMARLRACMLVLALCLAMRAKCLSRYSRVLGTEAVADDCLLLFSASRDALVDSAHLPVVWWRQLLDDVMYSHQAFFLPRH